MNRYGLAFLLLLTFVLAIHGLFLPDFADTDAAVHAMDGVFFLDLIRDLPSDPKQYAIEYYARHPSLGLVIYPPLLPIVLVPFYALFGISAPVARAVIVLFALLNVAVFYRTMKTFSGRTAAFVATLILVTNIEIIRWSREVMLEIPALLFMNLAAWWCLRAAPVRAAIFLAAAVHTKQTAGFLALPILIFSRQKVRFLFFFIALVVPLALITMKFGHYGTVQLDPSTYGLDMLSWSYWTEWAIKLGRVIDPVVLMLAAIGISTGRRSVFTHFMTAWFIVWYLTFSYLPIKTLRFAVFVVPPVAALAGIAARSFPKWGQVLVMVFCALLTANAFLEKPSVVTGYEEAAAYVAELDSQTPVLFDGHHSPNFVYHMRRLAEDRIVLRGSKMITATASGALTSYPIIETDTALIEMLTKYGVEHIVVERDPEVKLAHSGWLRNLLATGEFENIKSFEAIDVYRFRNARAPRPGEVLEIYVPSAGMTIRVRI